MQCKRHCRETVIESVVEAVPDGIVVAAAAAAVVAIVDIAAVVDSSDTFAVGVLRSLVASLDLRSSPVSVRSSWSSRVALDSRLKFHWSIHPLHWHGLFARYRRLQLKYLEQTSSDDIDEKTRRADERVDDRIALEAYACEREDAHTYRHSNTLAVGIEDDNTRWWAWWRQADVHVRCRRRMHENRDVNGNRSVWYLARVCELQGDRQVLRR